MSRYKIILVHGYLATPQDNWFPHFKKFIEQLLDVSVVIPAMPNSSSPDFHSWLIHLRETINIIDDRTIFVGHSLGCVTILSFLEKYFPEQKIKGLYLVSGFVENTPLPQLSGFVKEKLNFHRLTRNAAIRVVISAVDDTIVPHKYSLELSERMDAEFILLSQGKHFIAQDGFTEFPELITKIIEDLT